MKRGNTARELARGYSKTSTYLMDTLRVMAYTDDDGRGSKGSKAVAVVARPSFAGLESSPDNEPSPESFSSPKKTTDDFKEATTVQEVQDVCDDLLGWKAKPYSQPAVWVRPPHFQKLGKQLPFKLAKSPADITPEWLTEVFRYQSHLDPDEAVTSLTSTPIGAGEGEFSELALIDITGVDSPRGAPKLPRNLVAKFSPPGLGGFQLTFTFGSESRFYNDLSDGGAMLVRPSAYFVGAKFRRCGQDEYCLLIENANPPQAPSLCFKRIDGCDSIPHLMLAVRGLARMHAKWWGATRKTKELSWAISPHHLGGVMPRLPSSFVSTGWILELKTGFKALPYLYSSKIAAVKFGEEYREFIAEVRPRIRRRRAAVVRELFRPPLTLVHGDTHLENIFFGQQFEGGAVFIDFGLTGIGAPLSDVSELLGTGMRPKVRRKHELEIVRHYHRCLLEYGVKDFSWEQCWADYKFQFMRVLIKILHVAPSFCQQRRRGMGMFAEKPSPGDAKLLAMYKEMNTRLSSALMDHGWAEHLDEMPVTANRFYRPCM